MSDFTENITFNYTTEGNNKTEHEMYLSYSFPGGMSVAAFHRACKRFGYALGFAQQNIEEYFGEDSYDDWE